MLSQVSKSIAVRQNRPPPPTSVPRRGATDPDGTLNLAQAPKPRETLGNKFYSKLQENNYANKAYIPEEKLYNALTKEVLLEWLSFFVGNRLPESSSFVMRQKFKDFGDYIFNNLRKILSILILTGDELVILSFCENRITDRSLPLGKHSLKEIKRHRLEFEFSIDSFWNKQFMFASFILDPSICNTVQSEQVLPIQSREFVDEGFFAKVYKIKVSIHYKFFTSRCPKELLVLDDEGNYYFAWKEVDVDSLESPLDNEEIYALTNLKPDTPNVVPLLGCFIQNKTLYMVFPFVEHALEKYMQTIQRPSPEDFRGFLEKAARMTGGLLAFHNPKIGGEDQGTVRGAVGGMHRDLSCHNILVSGQPHLIFMISDFGLARFVDNSQVVKPGYSLGVKWDHGTKGPYTAPECRPKAIVSRTADVFSMGAILLEVAIYALRGPRALEKFRQDRITEDEYALSFHDGRQLKESVLNCIRDLKAAGLNRPVLHHYLLVVKDMLNPDPNQRASIQDSWHRFQNLFQNDFPDLDIGQIAAPPVSQIQTSPSNHEQTSVTPSQKSSPGLSPPVSAESSTTHQTPVKRTPTIETIKNSISPKSPTRSNNKSSGSIRRLSRSGLDLVSKFLDYTFDRNTKIIVESPSTSSISSGPHELMSSDIVGLGVDILSNNLNSGPMYFTENLQNSPSQMSEPQSSGRSIQGLYCIDESRPSHSNGFNERTVQLPNGILNQLKALSKRDTVFVMDDSKDAHTDWGKVVEALKAIAPLAIPHDTNGIDILRLSQSELQTGERLKTTDELNTLIGKFKNYAVDNINSDSELYELFDIRLSAHVRHWKQKQKQEDEDEMAWGTIKGLNLIVITNGSFLRNSDFSFRELKSTLEKYANKFENLSLPYGQIGIQFVLVGGSEDTWTCLRTLDDNLETERDIVDATKYDPRTDHADHFKHRKILMGGFVKGLDEIE